MSLKRSPLFAVLPALLIGGCGSTPASDNRDIEITDSTAATAAPVKFEFKDSFGRTIYPDGSIYYTIDNRRFLTKPFVTRHPDLIDQELLKSSRTAFIDLGSLFDPNRTIEVIAGQLPRPDDFVDAIRRILGNSIGDTDFASETNLHKIVAAARLGDRKAWLALARIVSDSFQKALDVTNYRVSAFDPQSQNIIITTKSGDTGLFAFKDIANIPLGYTMLEGYLRDCSNGNISLTTLKPYTDEARFLTREFKRIKQSRFDSDAADDFMEEFNKARLESQNDSITQ